MSAPAVELRGLDVISMPEPPSDMPRRWFLCSLSAFSIEYEGSPLPLRSPGRYVCGMLVRKISVRKEIEEGEVTYHVGPAFVVAAFFDH